ncbi:MAG: sugar phosphate isomerase/epimerase [Planctomycetota bacterium]|nr:MAG: sugar phosphate isomerase/epimerase [Planctomycetota bacterium]
MRTGMNLLLWTTHVTEQHYPLLATLRETGYDGVEIPLGQGDEAYYRALGAELDRMGLARTAVTSLMAETNPVSPDAAVRRAAVERLKWAIDNAAALGCELLCGPFHSAFKVFTGLPPTDDERQWSAEVLREGAEHGQAAGVTLAIEALNRFECYLVTTMADARDLVRRADHDNLFVHYDTHHMHIEEKSAAGAIGATARELRHVHISENDRGTPGSGQVAWDETFKALKAIGYDGWLTIESFSRLDPGFAGAIHIWRDFDALEDVYTAGLRFMRRMWAGE